ncbi:hypothetical protein BD410DRAFT_811659 [Rickenella mellea]|uniref:Copper transport protein n=1 Tax=Rickenella mellea TaxID=50990 RepID=A0A4Y7QMT7_9AGAM|nr:hypothetical protein BD410DRAFT_811659 [Rickenella mellea]
MSTNSTGSGMEVMMTPWLHFNGGDFLYFQHLAPSSNGAIAGASIALFLLAVFERFAAGMRGTMERRWRQKALAITSNKLAPTESPDCCAGDSGQKQSPTALRTTPRTIAPFIPSVDLVRGCMHSGQAVLQYALMLAVMTFQAAYIISIVVGLGVGEVIFGRPSVQPAHHAH